MKKKFFLILFLFLSALFISNKIDFSVQAQETPSGPGPQTWNCLKATQVGGQTTRPPKDLDVTLTGKGYASLTDIYVVVCAPDAVTTANATAKNYKCTTGNPDFDRTLFGSDLTSTISPMSFEVPKGSVPPQPIQAVGDEVNQVMHIKNASGHVFYAFFGVVQNAPNVNPGQGNTIQYGTFKFQQDPSGCLSIRWDPYGRIFDSQSLEPIRNVRIALLDKDKKLFTQHGLRNPEVTENDGLFNFFVDIKSNNPESFYLVPTPPPTHTFTANPNLNPNFTKAYSDLYKPDDEIIEMPGHPEHRDVPLDPGANPPYRSEAISMSASSVRLGNWTRYEGAISHPLSIVTLVGKFSGTEVARATADKDGFWTLFIPNDKIPSNEPLRADITKVDLTTLSKKESVKSMAGNVYFFIADVVKRLLSLTSKDVSAQITQNADVAEFQPIYTYVEGYARDKNGKVMPNAKVNVKFAMSDGLYTQTVADENGYFYLPPDNLPIITYYLEFVPPNSAVGFKVTTSDFAKMNQEYLEQNNINLMSASKNGESLLPTTPPQNSDQNNPQPSTAPVNSMFAANSMNMILLIIAFVVALGVIGGILLYIKKKKSETNDLL